jgi:hypothetical protein
MTDEKMGQKIDSTGTEKQQNEKLLRLETGYGQHAMPLLLHPPHSNQSSNP